MTARFPPFAFVELVSPYNKKNIKFISSRHHVISSMYFMPENLSTIEFAGADLG